MIALAMNEGPKRLIICNGYKDHDYIRLALLGRKLGKKVILVVEQLSEIDDIIRISEETGVKPMIGFRAKLQTRGEGRWALSTGDNAKFGLNTAEILFACEKLKAAGLKASLRLFHFHIGSQVPNIITIKNAVIEATRFYCQLAKMGFPMGYLDVGGGLGIDYDGSRSNFESSMNYSMEEYARDVVFNIREICRSADVAEPDIVSESGRAVVAPHSMLVVEVFERINKRESLGKQHQPKEKQKIVTDLEVLLKNKAKLGRLERFHDALQKKDEAFSLFNLGYLDLENRAAAEQIFWQICEQIAKEGQKAGYQPEELHDLSKLLADQYVCNFSVFQSLLDHWALKQLFPIAPLHRLNERPTVNAILVDITCDSDGKISSFIDLQDVKDYVALHPLNNQALLPRDLPHRRLPGHHGRPAQPLRPGQRGARVPRGRRAERLLHRGGAERQPHRRRDRGRPVPAGGPLPQDEGPDRRRHPQGHGEAPRRREAAGTLREPDAQQDLPEHRAHHLPPQKEMTPFSPRALAAALGLLALTAARADAPALYQDKTAAVEARVDDLLPRLTLDEKLSIIGGDRDFYIRPIPRLGIPEIKMADGPLGVRNYGPSTAYPATIGLAAAWDGDLARQFGAAVGSDARARGVHIMLGPAVNINRVPQNGRNFEYLSEDPYLAGAVATQIVQGIQSQGVVATVKHFAANNQETERGTIDVRVSERALREIYLPAFQRGGPGGPCLGRHERLQPGEWRLLHARTRG